MVKHSVGAFRKICKSLGTKIVELTWRRGSTHANTAKIRLGVSNEFGIISADVNPQWTAIKESPDHLSTRMSVTNSVTTICAEHWNRFKGNVGENFWETGWSAYGLFRAFRYHLELNWTELNWAGRTNEKPASYGWQLGFSKNYDVTNYGNGWRKAVVNWRLEFASRSLCVGRREVGGVGGERVGDQRHSVPLVRQRRILRSSAGRLTITLPSLQEAEWLSLTGKSGPRPLQFVG